MGTMTMSEVPAARTWVKPNAAMRVGMRMIPPPTPRKAESRPIAAPAVR